MIYTVLIYMYKSVHFLYTEIVCAYIHTLHYTHIHTWGEHKQIVYAHAYIYRERERKKKS